MATRIWVRRSRLSPTQKMRMEPTKLSRSRAFWGKKGPAKKAAAVTAPWKSPTGTAEKMLPFPWEAAMTQMMMASSTPLATSTEWSPATPSRMEPTTAMAPMHTVQEADTKAEMNRLSPLLPLFSRSQLPSRATPPSRFSSSPATAPRARLAIMSMVPRVDRPSPSTVSI